MTAWGSRLPFSLDPLIAEAKRRMRRRRLLVAVVVVLLAGSALRVAVAFNGSASPSGSALKPSLARAQLPPLSNLATRMAFCGNRYSSCHSPDGKWSVVYVNRSPGPVSYNYSNGKVSGYEPAKVGCTLIVTRLATGRREDIGIKVPACDHGLWLGHAYVVEDPALGSPGRLLSVDLPSRRVTVLAHFGSDVVSPNGRWIAGEAVSPHPVAFGGETPRMIAVLSLENHTCRVVTQASGPHQEIAVDRSPWEFGPPFLSRRPFKNPVVWRTVVQRAKKLKVVTGPGTGFTRNSRSLIVAEWQYLTKRGARVVPIHKRLVKFDLASLHTACPASVAPR